MKTECPYCGGNLLETLYGYECSECGSSLRESELEDEEFTTCSHCGYSVSANASWCPHCGESLDSFDSREGKFGLCNNCGEYSAFEPSQLYVDNDDPYTCALCGTVADSRDLISNTISSAPDWSGKLTGCYACGAEAPIKAKEDELTICEECGFKYFPRANLAPTCEYCGVQKYLDDLAPVLIKREVDGDLFYCFDCKRTFKVEFEPCRYCTGKARLSLYILGTTFECMSCGATFVPEKKKKSRVQEYLDLDSYYNSYNVRTQEEMLEDSLGRKYLLEVEV